MGLGDEAFTRGHFGMVGVDSGRPLFYDRQGNPIVDTLTWARMFAGGGRVVGSARIHGWWVSTVWLGVDHSHGFGPPLIFETMIFRLYPKRVLRRNRRWIAPLRQSEVSYMPLSRPRECDMNEQWQDRYSTEAEAYAGHLKAVRWCHTHSVVFRRRELRQAALRKRYPYPLL